MAIDDTNTHGYTLAAARADLVAAIQGAGSDDGGPDADNFEGLVKVGGAGFAVELRLNGTTIPLDGNAVNDVPADRFDAFLDAQANAVAGGALDAEIERAIAAPGPEKALVRVRALEN